MYKVKSPLRVPVSKKKFFTLNLNIYRNTHYAVLGEAKIVYTEHMKNQISTLPVMDKVELLYVIYPKTKLLCDISNVGSIHDKFFCDALVKFGRLPDDDYRYLKDVHYRMGKVDPKNPRVDIYLLDPEKEGFNINMKHSQVVSLTADEVQEAIENYLDSHNVHITVTTDSLEWNDDGTLTITEDADASVDTPKAKEAPPVKRRKRRTKAEMEADKAAEEVKNKEESVKEETTEEQDDLFDESESTEESSDTVEDDDMSLFD